jgi:hypothetical protein
MDLRAVQTGFEILPDAVRGYTEVADRRRAMQLSGSRWTMGHPVHSILFFAIIRNLLYLHHFTPTVPLFTVRLLARGRRRGG